MSTTDTVIVNPVMLRQGLEAFRKSSSTLATYISELDNITSAIKSAYSGNTSDQFQLKMKKLSQNWDTAKKDLDAKLSKNLESLTEQYEALIKESENTVESLDSNFTMQ